MYQTSYIYTYKVIPIIIFCHLFFIQIHHCASILIEPWLMTSVSHSFFVYHFQLPAGKWTLHKKSLHWACANALDLSSGPFQWQPRSAARPSTRPPASEHLWEVSWLGWLLLELACFWLHILLIFRLRHWRLWLLVLWYLLLKLKYCYPSGDQKVSFFQFFQVFVAGLSI